MRLLGQFYFFSQKDFKHTQKAQNVNKQLLLRYFLYPQKAQKA